MTDDGKLAARDRLLASFAGFNGTWVLVVGRASGLLQAVASSREATISEETLAAARGFHLPYVRVWCRAAYAFGFLDHDAAAGYRLAPHMRELLLDATDPLYCGGRADFYAATTQDFQAFPERLRDGRAFPREAHDPGLLTALSEMTRPDFANLTSVILPRYPALVARLNAGGAAALDVGCGAGLGLVHLARAFPALSLVGIEPSPASFALAAQAVAREGLSPRVQVEPQDARTMPYRGRFDLAVLNVSLHETGGEDAWRETLARCREALKPGGWIVVSELPYPGRVEEYRGLVSQLLAGVQHHEALVGCSAITVPQLASLLTDAAFSAVERVEQPNPARVVYVAQRPTR